MGNHNGAWYAVGDVKFDGQGNPYRDTSDGQKDYIPPIAAAQYKDDPRMVQWAKAHGASIDRDASGNVSNITDTSHQNGSFTGGQQIWDSEGGGYKGENFWNTSLGGLILGAGSFSAPFVASALTAAPAVSTAAAGSGAAAPSATAPLASTVIGNGYAPAIAGGAGSTMPVPLASTAIGNGYIPGVGGTGTKMPTESFISKLMGKVGSNEDSLSTISKLLGSMSSGEKADRVVEGQFSGEFDRNSVLAQNAAIAARQGALKNLAQSKYLQQGGSQFKAPNVSLGGNNVTLPSYGFGPTGSSDAQKAGAKDLEGSALKTLAPGGTYQPQPLDGYAKPGKMEKVGDVGATISGLLPPALNIWKMF